MPTFKVLRKFEKPTNVVIVGDDVTWMIDPIFETSKQFTSEQIEFIKSLEDFAFGITDDEYLVDVLGEGENTLSINTSGHINVLTENEFEKVRKFYDFHELTIVEIPNYVGEIRLGVHNNEGLHLNLEDNDEYYILHSVTDEYNEEDMDRWMTDAIITFSETPKGLAVDEIGCED